MTSWEKHFTTITEFQQSQIKFVNPYTHSI